MEGYREATGEKNIGIIGVIERPPIPTDNLCQVCKKNNLKYIHNEQHVCLYCWIRSEYTNLSDKSDEEIELIRQNVIKEIQEEPKNRGLVNMGSFVK